MTAKTTPKPIKNNKKRPPAKLIKSLPISISKDSITIFIDGQMLTAPSSHLNYAAIKERIKKKKWAGIAGLFNPVKELKTFSSNKITIKGEKIYYGDITINNEMVERIFTLKKEGFDFTPTKNFLQNVMENPNPNMRNGGGICFC